MKLLSPPHTDQALAMLEDPSDDEHFVLSTIPYQRNNVILHKDDSLLTPKSKAPWQFHVPKGPDTRASFTTNISLLYQLNTPAPFCLTMNSVTPIAPEKTLGRFTWHHPVYTQRGMGIKKDSGAYLKSRSPHPTTAGPTGATASMKTGCAARSRSPRRLGKKWS